MSKRCTRCGVHKPMHDFSAHTKARDGKQSHCKSCVAERARLKRIGRPCEGCGMALTADIGKSRKRCHACMSKCSKCGQHPRLLNQRICSHCQKECDDVRKASDEYKFKVRISKIAYKYDVRRSLAATLAAQVTCEACDKPLTRKGDQHVDHCHTTGAVRGVLCFNCNAALGHLKDSVARIEQLHYYLQSKDAFIQKTDLEKARHFIDRIIKIQETTQHG